VYPGRWEIEVFVAGEEQSPGAVRTNQVAEQAAELVACAVSVK
jgi:hypothetical protein